MLPEEGGKGFSMSCLQGFGCKVGADTGDELGGQHSRKSSASEEGRGYKSVCGSDDIIMDCFSYTRKDRSRKRNNEKDPEPEKEGQQDRRFFRSRLGGSSEVYEDPHRLSVRRHTRNEIDENVDVSMSLRKQCKSTRDKDDSINYKDYRRFVLIAVGGHGSWEEPLDAGEIYDSASNKWTEIQKLPADFGIVCCGVICKGTFFVYSETDRLVGYDIERGYWVRIQTSPPPPRIHGYYPQMVSGNSRLFMLSVSWCEGEGQIGRRNKAIRKMWELDLNHFTWAEIELGHNRQERDVDEGALLDQQLDSPCASDSSENWKRKSNSDSYGLDIMSGNKDARSFTFSELATATKNFREANLIGEGGFGKGNQEFIVEVLMLSLLHHPNLVKLIGYCAEGDHRLLVYEYMPLGSLADHLYEKSTVPILDWNTRMKIAVGAAKGIEYLHCSANPPVIYRDLKSANILLDNEFNPRLSDFGLAKLGPVGDKTHVSTRVMGTYGYCAPDYAMSGKLTIKSDIFSFGVVLLELVTGRKAFDLSKKQGEQSIVAWSRPLIRDKKRSTEIVDARLEGRFPERDARHLIDVISMLLKEDPNARPPISDIVVALEYLAAQSSSSSSDAARPPRTSSSSPIGSQQRTNSTPDASV
ncbi:hypothetical protein V2J09_017311 [Rumex salicifolius]